ncbi:hypothetical protein [uncultured Prevotella sp.]|nr:hypothetical protein [uncultured Prevotella sp.]
MNYSRQGKHRRLWRPAVATQPTIAGTRGTRNSICLHLWVRGYGETP